MLPFHSTEPSYCTSMEIGCSVGGGGGSLVARGRSIFTAWVMTGSVMMKMISSTSMMTTSGTTLIVVTHSSTPFPTVPMAIAWCSESCPSVLVRRLGDEGDLEQVVALQGRQHVADVGIGNPLVGAD